ncbi:MAG: threonine synthase [Elusimicrobia bacterium]|nr:threonine synthase [Elusimicrobiota bacterium]
MAGVVERFRKVLPVSSRTPIVSLEEGSTPLLPAPRLARRIGLPAEILYLKWEGSNPTGSFKDRGMALAVSKALEEGSSGILCASTGNTAASAAAYAARAGLSCTVLLPAGKVALGKLVQALAHGARVVQVRGNFDQALTLARQAAKRWNKTLVNSLNPYRLQGQKTAAYEVTQALGRFPDYQFMPVGNAGNITAYWMGYREIFRSQGKVGGGALPKMMGFQAQGAAPLVLGRPVLKPRTLATAIRIGNPISWKGAVMAVEESGGEIGAVSDREILQAYHHLARSEGIFCEPSSATGVAGLVRCLQKKDRNLSSPGLRIVCVLTGHGLKDPETILKGRFRKILIPPQLRSLEKVLRPCL